MLLLFVSGIGYNLARGQHPDCHCFGQLHSAPAGWPTLMRNLILATIAGFVVGFGWSSPGIGALDWVTVLTATQWIEVLVGLVVIVLFFGEGWMLLQTMTQQGRLLLRLDTLESRLVEAGLIPPSPLAGGVAELPVGSLAPTFDLPDLKGKMFWLDDLRVPGKPLILLFVNPDCGPCNALLPEVGRWQYRYANKLTITLISWGTAEDNRSKTSKYRIAQVLLQQDHEVAEAYQPMVCPAPCSSLAIARLADRWLKVPMLSVRCLTRRSTHLP